MQELNRFVHYYSRFKNHENSYKVRCGKGTLFQLLPVN